MADIPFEFVCEVASAGSVAEAGHIKCIAAAARHDAKVNCGSNLNKLYGLTAS